MRTALRHPGRLLALAILTALVAVPATVPLAVALAAPAQAHDVLVASDPADGATVEVPPDQVVLTFSAEQMALGHAFQVTDPDGTDHVVGDSAVDGRDLLQGLDGLGPAGEWTVEWRSVASDGHPISGSLTFTVLAAAEVADAESGTADDAAAPGALAGADATGSADSARAGDPVDAADARTEDATDGTGGAEGDATRPAPWLVALLAVGALAAAALVWALVRRLGPRAADGDEPPGRDAEDRP